MPYPLALLLLFSTIFTFYYTFQLFLWLQHKALLSRLKKAPFPENYKEVLEKTPFYSRLNADDKALMHYTILRFINEKEFIGLNRMAITDEVRIIIAFYACLLLLHIKKHDCYGNLKTILVYPYEFIVHENRSYGGIYTKERFILEGQSASDTVVVSWHNVKKEAYHLYHQNVILHEFAHEIDFMDGEIDGVPPMETSRYREWTRVMYDEYKKLSEKSLKGRYLGKYKLLGNYAATNEAEFFAVVTERFFEAPQSLKKHFPDIYKELKQFYRIDPASLFSTFKEF